MYHTSVAYKFCSFNRSRCNNIIFCTALLKPPLASDSDEDPQAKTLMFLKHTGKPIGKLERGGPIPSESAQRKQEF